MFTENSILMRGDPDRIFELAANIQDWPRLLPHYRYVVVEQDSGGEKIARMGASRDGFPVAWRTLQELAPNRRRIVFKHIGGITRGMDVEWRLVPEPAGVRVTISHRLTYAVPLLGPLFARYIVGGIFIHNIAGKTLRCFKELVEKETPARARSS